MSSDAMGEPGDDPRDVCPDCRQPFAVCRCPEPPPPLDRLRAHVAQLERYCAELRTVIDDVEIDLTCDDLI